MKSVSGVKTPGLVKVHADAIGQLARIDSRSDAGDLGVEAQPLGLAEQIAVQPVGFEAGAVERGIAAADAEAAQRPLLHDDGDRQAAARPELLAFLDAQRAEHLQPRQPLVGALQIVRDRTPRPACRPVM